MSKSSRDVLGDIRYRQHRLPGGGGENRAVSRLWFRLSVTLATGWLSQCFGGGYPRE
jgi:hypothetical protein